METLKYLINQKVEKLFLAVWPPLGEDKESDIDMSFCFVFSRQPNNLCMLTTNKEDMWTPLICFENIPKNVYPWSAFKIRMRAWMVSEEASVLETEYYDVTDAELFNQIVFSTVQSIELIGLTDVSDPFGVKILFEKDYIISSPISDGNTVETARFNKNDNLLNFKKLGDLEFKKLIIQ